MSSSSDSSSSDSSSSDSSSSDSSISDSSSSDSSISDSSSSDSSISDSSSNDSSISDSSSDSSISDSSISDSSSDSSSSDSSISDSSISDSSSSDSSISDSSSSDSSISDSSSSDSSISDSSSSDSSSSDSSISDSSSSDSSISDSSSSDSSISDSSSSDSSISDSSSSSDSSISNSSIIDSSISDSSSSDSSISDSSSSSDSSISDSSSSDINISDTSISDSSSSDSNISDSIRKRRSRYRKRASVDGLYGITLLVGIDRPWKRVFRRMPMTELQELSDFVDRERRDETNTICPAAPDVFSWTHYCKPAEVKVVIVGQDPYANPDKAHGCRCWCQRCFHHVPVSGLAFSVRPGVKIPRSLRNIFKELESDIETFEKPDHGNLIGLAKQGVLLLNAVMTARAGKRNSHKGKGWEKVTQHIIRYLIRHNNNLVFMLWGNAAKKTFKLATKPIYLASVGPDSRTRASAWRRLSDAIPRRMIERKFDHRILEAVHPSPLSAFKGFFGCRHFSKCNKFLRRRKKDPIDWSDLPRHR